MGKAKKGKRSGKDDDMESDVDIDEQSVAESVKIKSKTKDKKKKKGDDVDELADELVELKVDKSKGKKGKKSKRGGDDDSEDDDDDDNVTLSKSQKRKGKKVNDDDDDNNSASDSDTDIKSKGKGKKNQVKKGFAALEINSDAESDNEVLPKAKAKAKKKKGKKNDDFDDDNDDDAYNIDNFPTKVDVKNKTNSKKNKKKNDVESEDDIPKPKGRTKKGKKASVSDDEDDNNILTSKPAKAKAVKSGFALLDVEGDDDDDDDDDDDNEDNEEPSKSEDESEKIRSKERPKGKQQQSQKNQEPQGKKGKKGKKKQDSDDEIEKALAELEMEYTGKKIDIKTEQPAEEIIEQDEISSKNKKEKVNKSKVETTNEVNNEDGNEVDGESGTMMKSAAQKKKEKKEREKQKKMAQKKGEVGKKVDSTEATKESSVEKQTTVAEKSEEAIEAEEDGEDVKKKKKKGVKEDPKDKGKGPGKRMLAAMQDALKKVKEDEERALREEEERIREEELREKARLEQLQLEQERKEKKKLKEKQRKERLKAEGKLLTTKQKQDRARAQAMLESLKAQGLEIPDVGEKKQRQRPSLGTRIRPNKIKQQTSQEEKEEIKDQVQVEIVDQQQPPQEKADEDERKKSIVEVVVAVPEIAEEVKDSWDADSTEDERGDEKSDVKTKGKGGINHSKNQLSKKIKDKVEVKKKIEVVESSASDSDSGSGDGSESQSDDESSDNNDDSEHEKLTDAEKKRERARLRIQNRRIEAEKKKSLDDLRAAVVCVLGHVDTGKTKILDKLRRTNVQDGEAGGITQQIGATNVPIDAIQDSTKYVKGFAEKVFKIPGLLIIDTPGHESFSNLRNRGSSLCDIAVLVVDIMHGLEPQTLESIGLLKSKKCPFVVALNKIDRLYDWQTMNRKDVQDIIKGQAPNTQREFEKRSKDVIVQFAEQGLNAALFYENPDPRSYVSLVPTSAITGEGMGNLLALIVDACQGPLAKRLMFSEELQATVLEVKALPGLGTTIDCILVNGTLREGETMIVAGTDGPIVTQIRSLLMPQPLKELRVKNAYIEYREIRAAQGVKIAAKDLDKAIAGLNLQVAQKPDEVDLIREEIAKELSKALGNIKLAERGVFVQASTLGALEALLDFLRSSKIPYAGIRIGPVVKKDVMKASIMLEHDSQYATILAFDVKIERDAQELADSLGVKIFQADIIYHLFDKFTAFREELKQRKRDEHKHIAVFPCKLKILPQFIFNSRDPIVMGVMVEAGIVKEGTPVCVPSKEFLELGVVTSIEYNHKTVESARKGQEVCIKIESVPGEAPKMFGRHFDEKDFITSKISRQSIDACKDYFRDDLLKTDWQLMVELKKLFQIL